MNVWLNIMTNRRGGTFSVGHENGAASYTRVRGVWTLTLLRIFKSANSHSWRCRYRSGSLHSWRWRGFLSVGRAVLGLLFPLYTSFRIGGIKDREQLFDHQRSDSVPKCTKVGNKDIRREFKEMVWACTRSKISFSFSSQLPLPPLACHHHFDVITPPNRSRKLVG